MSSAVARGPADRGAGMGTFNSSAANNSAAPDALAGMAPFDDESNAP